MDVNGACDPGFAAVGEAFADGFRTRGELGAALCVVRRGRPVVDVWGGHADVGRTRAWHADTVVNVYSAVKGATALCAHRVVERGLLDLDAPVARVWPQLARGAMGDTRVHELLSHRAGLAALHEDPPPGAGLAWEPMIRALEDETPWWPPGSAHGYHAITFGWLVGEVVQRAAGKSPRELLDEIVAPLALDLDIGWHGDASRVAEMAPVRLPAVAPGDPFFAAMADPRSLTARALFTPSEHAKPGMVNSAAWRAAVIPASNGHASARGLARMYGALAGGGDIPLLSAETLARAVAPRSEGPDRVLMHPTRFGLGFMLSNPLRPFSPNARAFGHSGAGGSVGFADPDAEIAFGYVVNQPFASSLGGDARWGPIVSALYAAL